MTVGNINTVNFDKLAEAYLNKPMGAGTSALKSSLGSYEMVQTELRQMMREMTPHLGGNVDIEA